jgi:uncharacterized membrane protein AbrB (regulator of aidB expression)
LVAFTAAVVSLSASSRRVAATTRRGLVVAGVALVVGFVIDGWVQPSGTLFGPALFAAVIAISGSTVRARVLAGVLAGAFMLLNAASLADLGDVDVRMSASGGGRARSVGFGVLLVALSAHDLRESRRRSPRVPDHSP